MGLWRTLWIRSRGGSARVLDIRSAVEDARLERDHDGLRAVAHLELLQQPGDVGLHRGVNHFWVRIVVTIAVGIALVAFGKRTLL